MWLPLNRSGLFCMSYSFLQQTQGGNGSVDAAAPIP